MAVLLKGAGGPSVELSEIQALFIVGEDSTTVHLKGYFDGPLRDFVWLVPVPSSSKLELSHNDIFERMNQRTLPRFRLFPLYHDEEEIAPEYFEERIGFVPDLPELTFENDRNMDCDYLSFDRFFPTFSEYSCLIRTCETILLEYAVEWETQAVTLINAGSHAEISEWARQRGYLRGTMDTEVVQSYLDEGHAILAVEVAPPAHLNHLKTVNRIQPLAFTYAGDRISIPLQSATSEGVSKRKLTVWIAAESRAIPGNYLHVHPNKARLNWMNVYGISPSEIPGNYDEVLSDAIAEAGQPAFGTDYAVGGGIDLVEPERSNIDIESLRNPESLDSFMIDLWYSGITPRSPWSGPSTELDLKFLQLLREHIPLPESVLEEIRRNHNWRKVNYAYAESQFYSFPNEYEDHYENEWFNFSGFVDDWITYIEEPNSRAHRAIVDRPYMTRLTTFFFSDAKTIDPVFDFNPDLGEVNRRPNYGKLGFECKPSESGRYEFSDLIPVVGLEGGTILRFEIFNDWYTRITRYGTSEVPPAASERIEQLSASGRPAIVGDREITRTVVKGTIPDRGWMILEFSRTISGRGPRYIWSTVTDLDGQFKKVISTGDQAGVSGSYQVRARRWDGEVVGQWHSIPLNRNQRQILELIPGERPRVVAVEPLDAAKEIAPAKAADLSLFTPNAPNPFNSRTVLSWFLNTPGPVRLDVYNTLGQRVRTLVDEVQGPGRHQVSWDARDQGGAPVAAGVYLSRLQHPGGVQTQQLLYLK